MDAGRELPPQRTDDLKLAFVGTSHMSDVGLMSHVAIALAATDPPPYREAEMTTTLQALDWPTLLDIALTRWYLDREPWDTGQCGWQVDCPDPVVAFVEYRVAVSPSDPHLTGYEAADLVCSQHLPEFIDFVLHVPGCNPLVADTVVEVGVDPALLRLTGVDPAFVEAKFNKHALGCAA